VSATAIDSSYVAYLTFTFVLVVTPGSTTAVVVRNTLEGGRRAGYWTALGAAAANSCIAIACGIGLSMLLGAWPQSLDVIHYAGAAFLAWLGATSLYRALRLPDGGIKLTIDVSDAPVVFSHSGARALADVPRNVPDDVLEAVGRTGGVVMATFVPWFVTNEGAEQSRAWWAELHRLREAHPDDRGTVTREIEEWERQHPPASVAAADVADHIDHIRAIAGIEAIGVGGDYDGVPTMGDELVDVSAYPLIFEELRARRYSDDDLRAVAGGNVLRLMRATEAVADRLRSRPPSTATIGWLDETPPPASS